MRVKTHCEICETVFDSEYLDLQDPTTRLIFMFPTEHLCDDCKMKLREVVSKL